MRPWLPLILLLVLSLTACTRSLPVLMQVTLDYGPGVPFEIYSDGRAVNLAVSGQKGDQTWSFPAQGTLRDGRFLPPALTMRLHYPCGWRELPLQLESWAPEYIRKTAEEHRTLATRATPPLQDDPSMSIAVDNRGGEVHTLEVGEVSYPVEGGGLARVDTYQPDCANAVVKIDGQAVGSLPAAAKSADPTAYREAPYLFVDPTAKRCYQLRVITYSSFAFGPGPSVLQTLRGRRLYVLEQHPSYVLTPAPGSISSQTGEESRYELTEKKCR